MADQSTFGITVENIVSPVHRLTVGWGDMGRTWVLSLPGSMAPDAVEAVVQTMRRVVGAAAEDAQRAARLERVDATNDLVGKYQAAMDDARMLRADVVRLTAERDEARGERNDLSVTASATKAEIERLHGELDALKASKPTVPTCVECGGPMDTWCERCVTPDEAEPTDAPATVTHTATERLWELMGGFDFMTAWADVSPEARGAFACVVGEHVDASKPTVDMQALDNLAYNTYWATPGNTEVTLRAVVRAVVARLGLTPATPQTGEVTP